jgi:hypothetical protein
MARVWAPLLLARVDTGPHLSRRRATQRVSAFCLGGGGGGAPAFVEVSEPRARRGGQDGWRRVMIDSRAGDRHDDTRGPAPLAHRSAPESGHIPPCSFCGGRSSIGHACAGYDGMHTCMHIHREPRRTRDRLPSFYGGLGSGGEVDDDGGVHGAPSVVLGVRTAPCNCRRRARSLLASPSGLVDLRGWRSPRLHSFIHSEPHDQQRALSRFAQYIRPGGAPSRITRADRCGLIALSASAGATQRSGRAWEPARAWERLYVGRRVIPGDGRRGTLTS